MLALSPKSPAADRWRGFFWFWELFPDDCVPYWEARARSHLNQPCPQGGPPTGGPRPSPQNKASSNGARLSTSRQAFKG